MNIGEAILLGALQGLTEFLPVSSSGHLVLAEHFLVNAERTESAAFNVLLHLGSLLAIVIIFRREILGLFLPRPKPRLIVLLCYASIPAALAGFVLLSIPAAKDALDSPLVAACGFFLTSVILFFAERRNSERVRLDSLVPRDFRRVGIVGMAQAVALLPGVSRSGSTIGAALALGWTRDDAVRLSFLMGLIAIGGAGLLQARDITEFDAAPALAGFASSLVFSLVGLLGVRAVVARRKLRLFAFYTAALGLISLIALAVG